MHRIIPFALLALALLVPPTVGAQRGDSGAVYAYDGSRGDRGVVQGRLQAGRPVEVRITGLNTLCFAPSIEVTPVPGANPGLDAITRLLGTAQATSGRDELDALAGLKSNFVDDGSEKRARGAVVRALDSARVELREVANVLQQVEYFAGTVEKPPCGLGRSWSIAAFAAQWTEAGDLFAGMDEAEDRLHSVLARLRELELIAPEELKDELRETFSALDTLSRALPPLRRRLLEARPRLDALDETSRMTIRRYLPHDTERMRVVLTLRRHDGGAAVADTLDEAVYRPHRIFVTTGAFATLARQYRYARVNRPVVRQEDGPEARDSTYSTYADRAGGLLDVITPAVQANFTLGRITGGISPLLTFGLAVRSVGDVALPEPFFGFGFGFLDRLAVSGGLHLGRNEALLLNRPGESEADVALRPVPVSITRDDAVAVRWGPAGFLTFSVRP